MDDYDDTEPFEFESATSPPPEGGLVNCQTFPSSIVQTINFEREVLKELPKFCC